MKYINDLRKFIKDEIKVDNLTTTIPNSNSNMTYHYENVKNGNASIVKLIDEHVTPYKLGVKDRLEKLVTDFKLSTLQTKIHKIYSLLNGNLKKIILEKLFVKLLDNMFNIKPKIWGKDTSIEGIIVRLIRKPEIFNQYIGENSIYTELLYVVRNVTLCDITVRMIESKFGNGANTRCTKIVSEQRTIIDENGTKKTVKQQVHDHHNGLGKYKRDIDYARSLYGDFIGIPIMLNTSLDYCSNEKETYSKMDSPGSLGMGRGASNADLISGSFMKYTKDIGNSIRAAIMLPAEKILNPKSKNIKDFADLMPEGELISVMSHTHFINYYLGHAA
jgi:hypothetical protein